MNTRNIRLSTRLLLSAMRVAFEEQIEGGKATGKELADFDPEALCKGMMVELEHTDDPQLALEIAMDHLTEFDDYYDALEEMEEKLKAEFSGADDTHDSLPGSSSDQAPVSLPTT